MLSGLESDVQEFRDAAASLSSVNFNDTTKIYGGCGDVQNISHNDSPGRPSKRQKKSSQLKMEKNDDSPEGEKFRCTVRSLERVLLENGFDSVDLLKVGCVIHNLE